MIVFTHTHTQHTPIIKKWEALEKGEGWKSI